MRIVNPTLLSLLLASAPLASGEFTVQNHANRTWYLACPGPRFEGTVRCLPAPDGVKAAPAWPGTRRVLALEPGQSLHISMPPANDDGRHTFIFALILDHLGRNPQNTALELEVGPGQMLLGRFTPYRASPDGWPVQAQALPPFRPGNIRILRDAYPAPPMPPAEAPSSGAQGVGTPTALRPPSRGDVPREGLAGPRKMPLQTPGSAGMAGRSAFHRAGAGKPGPSCDTPPAGKRQRTGGADRSESGLPGPGLQGSSLPGSSLPGSGLPGSGLPGSGLPGSRLPGSRLPGSSLPGSGLPGSSLPGSSLPGSSLPGSGLPGSGLPAQVGLGPKSGPDLTPTWMNTPAIIANHGQFPLRLTLGNPGRPLFLLDGRHPAPERLDPHQHRDFTLLPGASLGLAAPDASPAVQVDLTLHSAADPRATRVFRITLFSGDGSHPVPPTLQTLAPGAAPSDGDAQGLAPGLRWHDEGLLEAQDPAL